MSKQKEFVGVLFDIVTETVIDRSTVIRGTYAEAMEDAKALVRVDESYCDVLVDGEISFGVPA